MSNVGAVLSAVSVLAMLAVHMRFAGRSSSSPAKLHEAILAGDADRVRALIEWRRPDNMEDLVMEATRLGQVRVVAVLFGYVKNGSLATLAAQTASSMGHTRLLPILARHRANLADQCLHEAARSGQTLSINKLIALDVPVDALTITGESALHVAVREGQRDAVRLLLRHGADCTRKTAGPYRRSALHLAALHGRTDMIDGLVGHGAIVNDVDRRQCTALHLAAREGHLDTFNALVANGADLSLRTVRGKTALHLAAAYGRLDVVERVLELAKDDIDVRDWTGQTALGTAASGGHVDVVRRLIKKGADPVDGLCAAAKANQLAVMQFLLVYVDVDALDVTGQSALDYATDRGHVEAVRLLISQGAQVNNVASLSGRTPLHIAAAEGHVGLVQALLNASARYDVRDNNGHTPIDCAQRQGRHEVVNLIMTFH